MKNSLKLLPALLITLSLGTGTVQAQLTQSNYQQAISGMISAGTRAAELGRLQHVSGVTIVRLRQIVVYVPPGDEPDVASISISARKNAAGISRLRSALKSNPVTRSALAQRGVPINRIVAAELTGGGYLKVFIL